MLRRPKDFQRSRVYRAEWKVADALVERGTLKQLGQVQLQAAVRDTWEVMGYAHFQTPKVGFVSKRAKRLAACYDPRTHEVRFALHLKGCTQLIICHELAHAATFPLVLRGEVSIHGPEFVATYLKAVRKTMREAEHDTLRRAMLLQGVRVAS